MALKVGPFSGVAVAPLLFPSEMFAVLVVVPAAPGVYCTLTAQLLPGPRAPATQAGFAVYPAGSATRAKAPPVAWPAVLVTPIVVIVSGPTFAPVPLDMTTIPVWAVVAPLVRAGVGAVNVIAAAVTVKVTALLAPTPGLVTVTFLAPTAAARLMENVVVIWVPAAFTVKAPWVTPVPEMVIAVAPVRFVPVMVTGIPVAPIEPEAGEMPVSAGAGAVTVNVTVLVVPFGVVTLTVLAANGAVAEIVKVAST